MVSSLDRHSYGLGVARPRGLGLQLASSVIQHTPQLLTFSRNLGDGISAREGDPHVGSIEGHRGRSFSHHKGFQSRAVAGAQPAHIVAVDSIIYDPDARTIKSCCDRVAPARRESSEGLTVPCPQFGNVFAAVVYHPNVGSVNGHPYWEFSRVKFPEHLAVLSQLRAGAVADHVRRPPVGPVRN